MSRRSPLNERYRKGNTPKGASKKSAASAKPARAQAKEEATRQHKPSAKQSPDKKKAYVAQLPDTPQYRIARKRWWTVLGVAVVILVVSLLLTVQGIQTWVMDHLSLAPRTTQYVGLLLSWIAMGLVGVSWWIDLRQLRPMIRAHQAGLTLEEYEKLQHAKRNKKHPAKTEDAAVEVDEQEVVEKESLPQIDDADEADEMDGLDVAQTDDESDGDV